MQSPDQDKVNNPAASRDDRAREEELKLFHDAPGKVREGDEAPSVTATAADRFIARAFGEGRNEVVSKFVVTVPSTKRLYIEFATAEIRIENSSDFTGAYVYSVWPIVHFLTAVKIYTYNPSKSGPTMDRWISSQPAGLVAQPGEAVYVVATKSNVIGNMQATFNLFGRYESL